MSRIGRLPVPIPEKVKVAVLDRTVHVEGPKGKLSLSVPPDITVEVVEGKVVCRRPSDEKRHRALHGLTRALVANMVTGVTAGFRRKLEMVGVGYRAAVQGRTLTLSVGYSRPVVYAVPAGIAVEVENQTLVTVSGSDKQLVGAVAAKIRSFRKPEPYKGKGIKYLEERIRRKAGKTGA
ncbi:MAG TPA: 50S ribosomal protein L6 [Candidatus Methylomirabilis sp.]|nr:50S ribosomal protein L6 [Candidatus Methylomirabilis sp.]